MQAIVLLKWTIGLVPERGTRMMAFTIIINGPANYTKAFMLKPLKLIFSDSIFENPANEKYTWVEKEKGFFLNDFRYQRLDPLA